MTISCCHELLVRPFLLHGVAVESYDVGEGVAQIANLIALAIPPAAADVRVGDGLRQLMRGHLGELLEGVVSLQGGVAGLVDDDGVIDRSQEGEVERRVVAEEVVNTVSPGSLDMDVGRRIYDVQPVLVRV